MFETVSPEAFIRRNRPIFYETLPLSLGLHVIVLTALAGSALSTITFPGQPPRLAFAYRIADFNPPPPPPPPPRAAQPVQKAVEVPLDKIVAPTVIPDTIPVIEPSHVVNADVTPPAPIAVENVAGGVPDGDPNAGVVAGTPGGEPKGVLGGLLLEDGRVHFALNTPLPLYADRQEYPEYPESARRHGQEDSVTVRYTIDKRGRVREIVILDHAERKIFEEVSLEAIRKWRFRPLVVDGEVREVVHDLTVFFRLK
jgi:periplasmic protein TonB